MSVPVLVAPGVDCQERKEVPDLELAAAESEVAWGRFVHGLTQGGPPRPVLLILDGRPGLQGAMGHLAGRGRAAVHPP